MTMDAVRCLEKLVFILSLSGMMHEKSGLVTATKCNAPCIVFTNTSDIVALEVKTSALHSLVSGLTSAMAIDVHFDMEYIFWSDVTEKNIKRSRIDGSGTTVVIRNIGVCEGLAVQWKTSQLFWTDSTHHRISVSDLAGNNQRSLLDVGNDQPRDIAVDPESMLIIWTDVGDMPKIETATLSGNQRVAIVTSDIQWPNGIDLDRRRKTIYWVDGGTREIQSVDYNGNNRKTIAVVSILNPFGVAFSPPFIYYTGFSEKKTIWRHFNAWRSFSTTGHLRKIDAISGSLVASDYSVRGVPKGIVVYDRQRSAKGQSLCAKMNGGCSHFCALTSSGHVCVCPTGLQLNQDGRTCEKEIRKFLLFFDAYVQSKYVVLTPPPSTVLYKASLDVSDFRAQSLFYLLGNQIPAAVVFYEDIVYVTDVAQGFIAGFFVRRKQYAILFRCNVKTPRGLAVDRVGRNLYWTDEGTKRIEVAQLYGTKRKQLIKEGLDEPRAIVLDERNGVMYWTDVGSNARIEQAAMDGSSRRTVVTGNLGWPNGLTLDETSNLLYWVDAKRDVIEVSDLNGENRMIVLSSANDIQPSGLALYEDMLYWSDWNSKSISRFNLTSKKEDMVVTGMRRPTGIHLYDGTSPIQGLHPCAKNNGLCSDLCLLRPQGEHRCACPTGIALNPDRKTCDYDTFHKLSSDKFMLLAEAGGGKVYKIPLAVPDIPCAALKIKNITGPIAVDYDPLERKVYWTDIALKQVGKAYPNGFGFDVIAKRNVSHPVGIAVDWIGRNLYWTDAKTKKIEISRLDGLSRTSLISIDVKRPRAVSLNIEARKMYWGDLGPPPKIEQANMDGTERKTLVSSGLAWINSIALDLKNELLYWCDGKLARIERIDLQGSNRLLILDLASTNARPFGLALDDDLLYWTDWNTKSVHKYNMTSHLIEVVVQGLVQPMEIHIHDSKTIPTVNRCPRLFAPENGNLEPCSNLPGKTCHFNCDKGYVLSGASSRTCKKDGTWTTSQPKCTDSRPPTFGRSCPERPFIVFAERGTFSAFVNWTGPTATDNSGELPIVTSNYQSPQRFRQGIHVITYTAEDQSGNRATCFLKLNVTVINCALLVVDPKGHLRMPKCGNHYGAMCNFSCRTGSRLNGSSTVTCIAPGNRPPGYWDNPLPVCQAIRCRSLSIPANGVKSGCSDPLSERYGTVCSFSCNAGYNVTGSLTRMCLANGTWSGLITSCQVIRCTALVPIADVAISPSSCLSTSRYGQTCKVYCPTVGYTLEGTSSRVCGSNGEWSGSNNSLCRDDTPPSFKNTCASNMVFYLPKCSSLTRVSWKEPVATDNSGHMIMRYPAVRPLDNLSIGVYSVHYSAFDNEGNTANCSFTVQVARKSCPVLHHPMHGSISSLSCGSAFGSQATLSCNQGYKLLGSPVRSCEEDGKWSGNTTICEVVTCKAIVAPSHGMVFPSQCETGFGLNYKTECVFACNVTNGYELEGPKTVSCLESGLWSAEIAKVICKDIQPPSIQCPSSMVVSTEDGKPFATVTWQVPVPIDNSNEPLNLSGLLPPQRFNVGHTEIVYYAKDSTGLNKSCTFAIEVKDIESPKIDSCPADIKIISLDQWHKLVLPAVKVSDNVGVHVFETNFANGSKITWGEYSITYTASDKAGNKKHCSFRITVSDSSCVELPVPLHGAKACETWLAAGKICTVHCNKGYRFANNPDTLYFCKPNGEWGNANARKGGAAPTVPDCSKSFKPKEAIINGEFHYLTDICGGEQMKKEIAKNFIEQLKKSLFGLAGACQAGCTIENVEVKCGEERRLRRDTVDVKRRTSIPLTVSYVLKLPLSGSSNSSLDFNRNSLQISNDILNVLNKSDTHLNISGAVIVTDPARPPEVLLTRLNCGKGQVQNGASCVNCPVGYFFNGTDCHACAVNHYQNQEAQTSCVACPFGTSTSGQEASKWLQDCQGCVDDPEYALQCKKMARIKSWCNDHELVTKEKCAMSCRWC